jgi:mono/diheme cytochrome c family protein
MKQNVRMFLATVAVVAAAGLVACSKQEPPKAEAPAAPPAASAPAPAAAAPAVVDAKALFEQKCSVCHTTERATTRTETREGWTSLVKKMQAKSPGAISDDDVAKIVDYLAAEHGKK